MNSGHVLSARFVLVRPLGQGATAQVWLARDRDLGGFVALKVLLPDYSADATLVSALERECERARSLVHPAIVRVDGLYRDAGQVFIAMEYLAGGDLTQYRARPATDVLRVATPVAEALAYAHGVGVVHRDVKTTNILLALDGTPRVGDFGLALARSEIPGPQSCLGSPYSMSPQQAEGAAATPADDVYAFGVLMYELLTGYPPFYPEITSGRRASEAPAPLTARFPVPEPVAALVQQCLAKSPSERPDMATVARELRAAAHLSAGARTALPVAPPVLKPPGATEPLRPAWQRPSTPAGPTPDDLRREGFRRGAMIAALLLLVLAAGVVFFILPERFAPAPVPVAAVQPPAASVPEPPTEPLDFAALAELKQRADDQLAEITRRTTALAERAAEQWAATEWSTLQAGLSQAADRYTAREFAAASSLYDDAANRLDVLESRASEVLKESLARGAAALDSRRSAEALEAFGLALKLAPGEPRATRGLQRAQSLDAVLALVREAQAAESAGQIPVAIDAFSRAVKLDPDLHEARAGLARVQSRAAGDAFADAMARGFAALSAKDLAAAKKGFEAARGIRPQAAEVEQALRQVEQEERTGAIAEMLASARTHESAERWQQALADFQAILQLDATVAAAQQGMERARPRAVLHDELQLYVTQPERLFSAPVRDTAARTLTRARAISSPGPVLARQIATLDDWLRRVTVPVQVALESDNLTQVTIYRVGDLGVFTQRAVELTPGRYTVVGTRPGYRDVRREITIAPGAAPQPIVIRCEDRI